MLGPRGWKWRLAGGLGIIAGTASEAQAFPTSRLVYSRGPGAEQCPEEEALRKEVASRLGYDPFFVWAERTIVARIERGRPGFRATVQLLDGKGIVQGSRSLASSSDDCADVAKSAALVISIGIDPEHVAAGEPKEAPAPPPEPSPPAPTVSAPPVAPAADHPNESPSRTSPATRIEIETGAGAYTALGMAPHASLGLAAFAGLTWEPLALYLEGRNGFDAGDEVETSILSLSLVACVRRLPISACAVGSWGALRAKEARSATSPYVALGARIGFDVPIVRQLFLRTYLEGAAPLDRTIVDVNGRPAWQLPSLSGTLGFEASLHFP
jgi:hypothetical protein